MWTPGMRSPQKKKKPLKDPEWLGCSGLWFSEQMVELPWRGMAWCEAGVQMGGYTSPGHWAVDRPLANGLNTMRTTMV